MVVVRGSGVRCREGGRFEVRQLTVAVVFFPGSFHSLSPRSLNATSNFGMKMQIQMSCTVRMADMTYKLLLFNSCAVTSFLY